MKYKLVKLIFKCLPLLIVLIAFVKSTIAQTVKPIESGIIEYERTDNVYKILNIFLKSDDKQAMKNYVDDYKSKNPQFKISKFSLAFNLQTSVYQPLPTQTVSADFLSEVAFSNIVLNDFVNGISHSQKNLLSTDFIVTDALQKIKWRITNESRDIAGFNCRRANALIMDSIYVVAFYTDEIVTKAGPESFSGLPGMIMGLAIPYEQVSWFATRYSPIIDNTLKKPPILKGKKVDRIQLLTLLKNNDMLKEMPKEADFVFKRAMF